MELKRKKRHQDNYDSGIEEIEAELAQNEPDKIVHELLNKLNGAPGRIRTADLPLRRGPRYPTVPPGLNLCIRLPQFTNGS